MPATHKLYVAAAKPNAAGGRGNDPDSFHVLVYAHEVSRRDAGHRRARTA